MIKPDQFPISRYEIRQHLCNPPSRLSGLGTFLGSSAPRISGRLRVWAVGRPPADIQMGALLVMEERLMATYVAEFESVPQAKSAADQLRKLPADQRHGYLEELDGFIQVTHASAHWVLTQASDLHHRPPARVAAANAA